MHVETKLGPRLSSVMAVSSSLFLTRLSAPSCMEVLPEQKNVIQAESLRAVFFFFQEIIDLENVVT